MLLFPITLACAVAVGYARGGRLGSLANVRFRGLGLLAMALALQGTLGAQPRLRVPAVAVSYCLAAAWLVANVRSRLGGARSGIGLLTMGWLLNAAAMAPSGGMPVSGVALRSVGAPARLDVRAGHLSKHVPAARHTPLAWLGDVIPVPPLRSVVSVGDLAMLAGVALVATSGMRQPAPEGPGCPPPGTELPVTAIAGGQAGGAGGPRRQRRASSEGPGCPPPTTEPAR